VGKKKIRAGRMGFLFIQKTASTGSSATNALVAANSLQPKNFSIIPVAGGIGTGNPYGKGV